MQSTPAQRIVTGPGESCLAPNPNNEPLLPGATAVVLKWPDETELDEFLDEGDFTVFQSEDGQIVTITNDASFREECEIDGVQCLEDYDAEIYETLEGLREAAENPVEWNPEFE